MKFEESMISGYLDGELSKEERAVVERHLEGNPKDRELLKTLASLRQQLASLPEETFSVDPVAAVRSRIAAARVNATAPPAHEPAATHSAHDNQTSRQHGGAADDSPPLTLHRPSTYGNLRLWAAMAMAACLLVIIGAFALQKRNELAVSSRTPTSPSETLQADSGNYDSARKLNEVETFDAPAAKAAPGLAYKPTDPAPLSAPASNDPTSEFSLKMSRNVPAEMDLLGGGGGGGMGYASSENTTNDSASADAPGTDINAAGVAALEPAAMSAAEPAVPLQKTMTPTQFWVYRAEIQQWETSTTPESLPSDYLDRAVILEVPNNRIAGIVDWLASQLRAPAIPEDRFASSDESSPVAIYIETDSSRAASLVQALPQWSSAPLAIASSTRYAKPIADSTSPGNTSLGSTSLESTPPTSVLELLPADASAPGRLQGARSPAPSELGPEALLRNAGMKEMPGLTWGSQIRNSVEQGKFWIILQPQPTDTPPVASEAND